MISLQHTVYIEHTDMQGIVNHTHYFNWMGWARASWSHAHAVNENKIREQGLSWRIVNVGCDYIESAHLGEIIDSNTKVEIKGARILFKTEFKIKNRVIARAHSEMVCVNQQSGRPQRLSVLNLN
jgi:YbgC/YbaW family acyl-CoA thioester hydrolase